MTIKTLNFILMHALFMIFVLLTACNKQHTDDLKNMGQINDVMQDESFLHFIQTQEFNVIVPSSAYSRRKMHKIKDRLKNTRLHFVKDQDGMADYFHVYHDDKRLKDLEKALMDETIPYIWCFKGGYGAQNLIPYLNKMKKPAKPKIIIGYSDITALHLFVLQKWGWKSIHGAMVSKLTENDKDPENFRLLQKMIQNPGSLFVYDNLLPLNAAAKDASTIQGQLTGGNLTVSLHTLKDFNEIVTKDKIVIFEDLNVECYHIDRMIQHMSQVGKLNDAKALIFGDFKVEASEEEVNKTLDYCTKKLNVPVFRWKKCGHGYHNFPFIYGADALISLNNNAIDPKAPYELKFFA
ncbi:MAG: hypothetical protein C0432_04255 [Candidatus Puniceispirillum sp.]|nr:hypothetical protein [Candidatus Pelagibacter sp.]MBA4283488.1 hypothetical protein [Candidatus Puniceispirillum sp.]